MPPVSIIWYDGGLRPPLLPNLDSDMKMGPGGTLFVGNKGKILDNKIVSKKLRDSYHVPKPTIPSSPGHEMEWILACKGDTYAHELIFHTHAERAECAEPYKLLYICSLNVLGISARSARSHIVYSIIT